MATCEQTNYRWRRDYGGLEITQAKKLREIKKREHQVEKVGG